MKYGIALEGGGSKGAYHAGALKAITEMKYDIGGITGTSIGSIVGAYFLQEGPDALMEFWKEIKPSHLIPESLEAHSQYFSTGHIEDFKKYMSEVKELITNGGIDISNLKRTLYDHIDESKVRASQVPYGLVTYSLTDMKPMELMLTDIPEGKLIEYLIASSYLPGFKAEKINGKRFLDGAFHDNLPVNLLLSHGLKHVIAIEVQGTGIKQKVKDKSAHVIYISPSDDTGNIIDFRHEVIEKNLKMGYYDALKVLNDYYGQWYYLTDIWSPTRAFEFLNSFTELQVKGLAERLSIKEIPYKRCLFEKIIPKAMDLLDIPAFVDYNMVLLHILEYVAKALEIDRFKLYTMDELIENVKRRIKIHEETSSEWQESVMKLLKATGLFNHTFKDQIIIGCVQLITTDTEGGTDELQV